MIFIRPKERSQQIVLSVSATAEPKPLMMTYIAGYGLAGRVFVLMVVALVAKSVQVPPRLSSLGPESPAMGRFREDYAGAK